MVNGKIIHYSGGLWGACSQQECMSSLTQSSAHARSIEFTQRCRYLGKEGRSSHEKGQKVQEQNRHCRDGTYVLETHRCRYCKKDKKSCRRAGTHPRVFQTGSFLRSCSTTSPSRQCLDSAKEVATCPVRIRHGYWYFFGSGLGKHLEIH